MVSDPGFTFWTGELHICFSYEHVLDTQKVLKVMAVITLPLRWRLSEFDMGQTQNTLGELFIYMASALGMLLDG